MFKNKQYFSVGFKIFIQKMRNSGNLFGGEIAYVQAQLW